MGLDSHHFNQRTQDNFIFQQYIALLSLSAHIWCVHNTVVFVDFLLFSYKKLKKLMDTSMESQNELAWLKRDASPAIGRKNCTVPNQPNWGPLYGWRLLLFPVEDQIMARCRWWAGCQVNKNGKPVIASNINVFCFSIQMNSYPCVRHFTKVYCMLKKNVNNNSTKKNILHFSVLACHIHNGNRRDTFWGESSQRRTNKNVVFIYIIYQTLARTKQENVIKFDMIWIIS